MQPPHQHSRINLAELKAQLVKKLGQEGSKQYFYYLNKLMSLKLSKTEFNKVCLRILGRENIPLHNQFICSILKNACAAKVPPPTNEDEALKSSLAVNKDPTSEGHEQNGSHVAASQASNPASLSNGDILQVSPRKTRTGFRDRRVGDRRSALGPNGKTNITSQQSISTESTDFNTILENGDANDPASRRLQHHQGLMRQSENEMELLSQKPARFSATTISLDGVASVHSKDQVELPVREDGKGLARSPLQAPIGVRFCPVSIGGARRAVSVASSGKCVSASNLGALLDSVTLRDRMQQIAAAHGLQGVSMDCANLLNNSLDAYLKGLIRPCVELVGARSGHEPIKNSSKKQQAYMKLVNGIRPGHHYQIQAGNRPLDIVSDHTPHTHSIISLQDFRVAMELNPQQLGEDWPLLLEKICTHAFDE